MNASDDKICVQPLPLLNSSPITTRFSHRHFKFNKPKPRILSLWAPPLPCLPTLPSSSSLPCSLHFFHLSLTFPYWNCCIPYYLYQSFIRFYQFCFLIVFDTHSLMPFFHSCFISGLLSLSTLPVTEPSNLFVIKFQQLKN